jgi:leader peptidase (prepilin peptidase)/N-methyltransferase
MPLDAALDLALAVTVLALLGVIAYRDAKTSEIPDALNLALLALGVAAWVLTPEVGLAERACGLVAVSGPMLLLAMLRQGSLGGGDVKLMAAAGFLLGWQGVLLAACLGTLAGGAYAVWLMAARGARLADRFPFGPALAAGIATAYLIGPHIAAWLS